ncbi:MAG: glycine cleavage T C-terminal barrel domain-containing protein, partial [Smithellaceae bacterium]|nr:glycine cleavage T C-terminal barrel domain-containing protein [Smithellaceae bacterium]
PLEVPYAWLVDWSKDFAGKTALSAVKQAGVRKKLAGFEMTGRGIARHGYPVTKDGRAIGFVTSGTFSPTLNKAIGLAFIDAECASPEQAIAIGIRDAVSPAKIVPLPFYKRLK